MKYRIEPMDEARAEVISQWKYSDPYSIYNMDGSAEDISELLNGTYYAVLDREEDLIGYYCFGESAQVPAGRQFEAYEARAFTDIGLGIRPDLCGQGKGAEFLEVGMTFGNTQFDIKHFRLTVAAFNQRAIKVYERIGFKKITSFQRMLEKEGTEFYVMILNKLF